MERFKYYRPLPAETWTYDCIVHGPHLGSVREPLLIVTDSGKEMIPASLEYLRSTDGERESRLLEGRYAKHFVDYGKVSFPEHQGKFTDLTVWDEEANISILALPIDTETRIFSARKSLPVFLACAPNTPQAAVIKRFVEFFPDINFGLLGSCSTLLNTPSSDVDLFVYGGKSFAELSRRIKDAQTQGDLGIKPIPEEWQNRTAENYRRRFGISFEQAKRIALLKNRFLASISKDEVVKVSITGCFSKRDYQFQTVLGSKRISKVSEEGIVLDTRNAASLPREYIVEIASQPIRIIAMQEVMKMMAEEGDKVRIHGTLREKDGVQFISIEDYEDIIVAS